MRYWLFKSEPSTWSWAQQLAKGDAGEEWDGVRNYQARNFMREMKLHDRGFFYHSQSEKAIVGLVEVCAEIHPDSRSADPRWECVDIRALSTLLRPITLQEIKSEPELSEMILVKNSRLSVQPVREHEFEKIMQMAKS